MASLLLGRARLFTAALMPDRVARERWERQRSLEFPAACAVCGARPLQLMSVDTAAQRERRALAALASLSSAIPESTGWRQGEGQHWLDLAWRPFWHGLSPEERASYLERWPHSPEWEEMLRESAAFGPAGQE